MGTVGNDPTSRDFQSRTNPSQLNSQYLARYAGIEPASWHRQCRIIAIILIPHYLVERVGNDPTSVDFQSTANPSQLSFQIWQYQRDSNPQPPQWQCGILTNWTMVLSNKSGWNRTNDTVISVTCSTYWATTLNLAVYGGIEPPSSDRQSVIITIILIHQILFLYHFVNLNEMVFYVILLII